MVKMYEAEPNNQRNSTRKRTQIIHRGEEGRRKIVFDADGREVMLEIENQTHL